MIERSKIRTIGRAEESCDQVIFGSTQYTRFDDEGAHPSNTDECRHHISYKSKGT